MDDPMFLDVACNAPLRVEKCPYARCRAYTQIQVSRPRLSTCLRCPWADRSAQASSAGHGARIIQSDQA
jgi:hypothetical protein